MNKLAHVSLFRFFYSFWVIIILFLTVLALYNLPLPITGFPTQKKLKTNFTNKSRDFKCKLRRLCERRKKLVPVLGIASKFCFQN